MREKERKEAIRKKRNRREKNAGRSRMKLRTPVITRSAFEVVSPRGVDNQCPGLPHQAPANLSTSSRYSQQPRRAPALRKEAIGVLGGGGGGGEEALEEAPIPAG
jgi:hypothetical protein